MQIEARKTGVEKFLLSSIWLSCECGLTSAPIAASADNLRPIAEEIFQGEDEEGMQGHEGIRRVLQDHGKRKYERRKKVYSDGNTNCTAVRL